MKKIILTGLTAAVLSANAMAAEVTGYTAPQSGQPATAAGVDSNFQALISAINDNSQRLDALESASGTSASLEDKLSGASFHVTYMGSDTGNYKSGQQSPQYGLYIQQYGGSSTITLNSDHTVTEVMQENSREIDPDKGECVQQTSGDYFCEHRVDDIEGSPETASGGSWSLNGTTLSITFPADDSSTDVLVTLNGEVLIIKTGSGFSVDGDNDDFDNSLAIGVRLPNAQ
ncbi:hypothetical protein A11A3_11738 [Alcanivorax hongdengensis A-11-3]|uniref:Uncharacterized protein n=1 Tax=Alcanivorax hongdengensis A-11-3 TaxID=1177179 RepID=L0WA80_9GAMM|nr:hypothetical protein [Alcanivorax hongdengensis]EKF73879.1 hypothetical protein A11A3_11738 [Alcanivorax hongdengensis A-11-3]